MDLANTKINRVDRSLLKGVYSNNRDELETSDLSTQRTNSLQSCAQLEQSATLQAIEDEVESREIAQNIEGKEMKFGLSSKII